MNVHTLLYVDDMLLAESPNHLQRILGKLHVATRNINLKIKTLKTKVAVIHKETGANNCKLYKI